MINIEKNLEAKLGILMIDNITNGNSQRPFNEMKLLSDTIREKFGNISPGKIEGVQNGRKLFRKLKIDPTRYRPSSEALLNRVLKSKPLFSVNDIVDIGNWCSLEFLLPICVYDFTKIETPISFSHGEEEDKYMGINNQIVNLHNKYVFKDKIGAFGSPLKDSIRTSVGLETSKILAIIVAPDNLENIELDRNLNIFGSRLSEYCSGKIKSKMVISP